MAASPTQSDRKSARKSRPLYALDNIDFLPEQPGLVPPQLTGTGVWLAPLLLVAARSHFPSHRGSFQPSPVSFCVRSGLSVLRFSFSRLQCQGKVVCLEPTLAGFQHCQKESQQPCAWNKATPCLACFFDGLQGRVRGLPEEGIPSPANQSDATDGSKPQNGVFLNCAYFHQVLGAGRFVCLRVEGSDFLMQGAISLWGKITERRG